MPENVVVTTPEQEEAIRLKYERNPDGAASYEEFRSRVMPGLGYVILPWCHMFVGIEPDGYAHT